MKRPAWKRVLLALAIGLVLLVGGGAVGVRYYFGTGVDYSHVVSIKQSHEYQDPALLAKAWAEPVAAIYQRDGFDSQKNPSFCGPTSAVNVLRSLGHTAVQSTILDGTEFHTTFGMLMGGMTLDQVATLMEKRGIPSVIVERNLTLEGFRSWLKWVNIPSYRFIANFHRGPLFGAGGGHFSPIAAYLPAEDLVLVLDVNDSYKPWLVKSARLFEAIDTIDRSTGQKRGLLVMNLGAGRTIDIKK